MVEQRERRKRRRTPCALVCACVLRARARAIAVAPLLRWSRDETGWDETVATIRKDLHRKFARRLAVGSVLHRVLLDKRGAFVARSLAGLGMLPLRPRQAMVR